MRKLRALWIRLHGIFDGAGAEEDFSAELESHLQMHIEDNLRSGMTPEQARRNALIQLGGLEQTKQSYREQQGLPWFEALWQDIRFGLRMLAKSPGFTVIAVVTLALGIGANTALFSVVNGVLLNPLPYPHPEQLLMVYSRTPQFQESSISYPNFLDWQRSNSSFSGLAAFRSSDFNLTGQGEAERLRGYMISADFFRVLGVNAERGRTFRPEEDQPGAEPVALISAGLWKRKFGGAEDIVGRKIELNGTLYTIVGVIPGSFQLRSLPRDIYTPIGQWNDPTFRDRRISMGTNA